MYDELVEELRHYFDDVPLVLQAADAIEVLSAHYCPHMIRNVHDRGDDSLCRVLGAEPPKEE